MSALDCRSCGACCVNPPDNRQVGWDWWVEIAPDDTILTNRKLSRSHVVRDHEGVPHLRVVDGGRCIALRGTPGASVRCAVYRERPSPCRAVQPGDRLCLFYRELHGFTPP